jgi:hypothetical protein
MSKRRNVIYSMIGRIGFVSLLLLWAPGCSDDSGHTDSAFDGGADCDGQTTGDAGTNDNDDADLPPDASTDPPTCHDGIKNGNETGHDCGGDCGNQDCCANGYVDVELGETGVDCGGDCTACVSTTYFVSNTGNDDQNSGTTPTAPWATIARINETTLAPGDAVVFERGSTWRETLAISHSGTPDAPITFGAYGTGAKPRILGSTAATGWTEVETNIWQAGNTLAVPESPGYGEHAASIFFGESDATTTWGNMEEIHLNSEGAPTAVYRCDEEGARFSLLDREYDWCWQDDHIYVYAEENPDLRYTFVEVPQRDAAITMADHPPHEHIVIDGLELLYAIKYGYNDGWPMNAVVRGLTIRNCHIGYMGVKGAASAMGLQIWHSDMLVRNNEIHDCGRRNISYNVYGDVRDETLVFENVTFDQNELHHGYHTTGFDISCGYGDTFRNFVFKNNFVWDDPTADPAAHPNDFTSMGFFLNSGPATFTDFTLYNNVLAYTKQKSIVLAGLRNSAVFNNTLYGMNERAGGQYRGMVTVSGDVTDLRIENNIFFGTVGAEHFVLQCVVFADTAATGTTLNHNLFFQQDDSQRIVTINATGESYTMAEWADYQNDTGWDADSPPPQDPHLVDPENHIFRLQAESPAIDNAGPEPSRTSDFAQNPICGPPDIGALEHQAP